MFYAECDVVDGLADSGEVGMAQPEWVAACEIEDDREAGQDT